MKKEIDDIAEKLIIGELISASEAKTITEYLLIEMPKEIKRLREENAALKKQLQSEYQRGIHDYQSTMELLHARTSSIN